MGFYGTTTIIYKFLSARLSNTFSRAAVPTYIAVEQRRLRGFIIDLPAFILSSSLAGKTTHMSQY